MVKFLRCFASFAFTKINLFLSSPFATELYRKILALQPRSGKAGAEIVVQDKPSFVEV